MPRKIAQWLTVLLGVLIVTGAPAQAQLFESDSKQLGNSKMDIVVKEVERRPRASLVAGNGVWLEYVNRESGQCRQFQAFVVKETHESHA